MEFRRVLFRSALASARATSAGWRHRGSSPPSRPGCCCTAPTLRATNPSLLLARSADVGSCFFCGAATARHCVPLSTLVSVVGAPRAPDTRPLERGFLPGTTRETQRQRARDRQSDV